MGSFFLFGIFIAFLLGGFFAGIEVGFISLNRLTVELRKKQRSKSATTLSQFLDEPAKFIYAMNIGIVIMLVIYGLFVDELLSPLWLMTESYLLDDLIPYFLYIRILFDLVVAAAAFLFYFFFSRALFGSKSDTLMFFLTPVFSFFYRLFQPLADKFVQLSEWILENLINVHVRKSKHAFTRLELENFIQPRDEKANESQELNKELFENALTLPYVKVRQCLVPRKEIESIHVNESIEALKKKFVETNLSKLVVYDKNIDHILGYVHQLSLFKNPLSIQSILYTIPTVPESMTASDLMNRLIKERKSMAWVVDEFGGTSGIVTMEDLLEELFGEIKDEYDTEELIEREMNENEFEFSGRLRIDELNEKYKLGLDMNDSETLSGFIIHYNESIPKVKERIVIGKFEFEILEVTDTRIELVRVKKSL
ncbi:MAG: HlyC/CorC family transporter [Chitinophagia bacterium]|nr:HlyC/CorC family transporter [Chitinophagia bacterium]